MVELTDNQWRQIEQFFPKSSRSTKGGRPRVDDRTILNGVLWILLSGSQWSTLPKKYGAYVTCWRRYKQWQDSGLWDKIWLGLLPTFSKKEQVEWTLAFLDGKFVPSKRSVSD